MIVSFYFPEDNDQEIFFSMKMPAVPRKGDEVEAHSVTGEDFDDYNAFDKFNALGLRSKKWVVSNVIWTPDRNYPAISIYLEEMK